MAAVWEVTIWAELAIPTVSSAAFAISLSDRIGSLGLGLGLGLELGIIIGVRC